MAVRTPRGMAPTHFTTTLMERVAPILDELSQTLNQGEPFDPAELDGSIRIVLAPHMSHALSSRLFRTIRSAAPRVEVYLDQWNSESLAEIAKGTFLIGASVPLGSVPREVEAQALADDFFTAYVREGHPQFGDRESLTLQDLDGIEIASLIIPDFNAREAHIERILKANGFRARVGFRSALPSAVTAVLRRSDMLYAASSFIDPDDLAGLKALDIRLNDRHLNYPVTAYFHRRNCKSPLVSWLLSAMQNLLESPHGGAGT